MNTAIDEIKRFQTDRGLDTQSFDGNNEATNIVEELLEMMGYDVPKQARMELLDHWIWFIHNVEVSGVAIKNNDILDDEKDKYNKVDALCDIIVFACGALTKLNIDPEEALKETAKEINSRTGQMINGKFEKDLSDEAKAKWYKADYSKCKLIKVTEKLRRKHFEATGMYAHNKEIEQWARRNNDKE